MAILGKVSLRTIINVGVVETASVIVLCYCLAVGLGHKKPWLPTISGCGENPPEEHFFRWGVFLSSLFPMLQAVVMRAAGRITTVTSTLGFVAGLCLSGVAVVQANEATHVHSSKTTSYWLLFNGICLFVCCCNCLVLAVTFFVCEDVKNFLLVMDDHSRMSRVATVGVLASNSVATLATIAKSILNLTMS